MDLCITETSEPIDFIDSQYWGAGNDTLSRISTSHLPVDLVWWLVVHLEIVDFKGRIMICQIEKYILEKAILVECERSCIDGEGGRSKIGEVGILESFYKLDRSGMSYPQHIRLLKAWDYQI